MSPGEFDLEAQSFMRSRNFGTLQTNVLAPASASNPFFGLITTAVSAPTSILGAGLGGDSSPRIIQLKAQVSF